MTTTPHSPPRRARLRHLVADLARSEDELRGVGRDDPPARHQILRRQARLVAELRAHRTQ
jgi:hypothetical protein